MSVLWYELRRGLHCVTDSLGGILDQAAFVYMNGRTLKKLDARLYTRNSMAHDAEDPQVEEELYANMVEDDRLVDGSVPRR
jgi:hypothetical protein